MCYSRPSSKQTKLTAIYRAIDNDDSLALNKAIGKSFSIHEPILVNNENYKPIDPDWADMPNNVIAKQFIEIAATKGRVNCVRWLLQQGANKVLLIPFATSQNPEIAGLKRFCDDKSNHQTVGSMAIEILKQASPRERELMIQRINHDVPVRLGSGYRK